MQRCVSLQTWSGSFLGSHAGGMLRILHSWALKILLMLGKAGFPLPSSYLISKHRVQNNCASLMGSQWKGDGTQSRCLSVLVNSPLKKKKKKRKQSEGIRDYNGQHCDWWNQPFSSQQKPVPGKQAHNETYFHKLCALNDIVFKAHSWGKNQQATKPSIASTSSSAQDINH